jgi:ligand-binding sensor domain-containing protein
MAYMFTMLIAAGCSDIQVDGPTPPLVPSNQQVIDQPISPPQLTFGQNTKFDHITLEEGLSQSTVNSILQDSQGFMWFGTMDGLNRYDGYEITVFKHDSADPDSLSQNHILALFEDSQGTLWIGTASGGLERYNRELESFTHYRHSPDNPSTLSSDHVTDIHEDGDGNLWIGTSAGLNKFNRAAGQFTSYTNNIESQSESFGSNHITVIHEDRLGTLWIGTLGGLLSFQPDNATFSLYPLIRPIPPRFPEGPERAKVLSILEDAVGGLWIGTRGEGLFLLEPQSEQVTVFLHEEEDPQSLGHNTVKSLFEDQRGVLWIGTGMGLDRLEPDSQQFVHYRNDSSQPDSLSDNEVQSVYSDEAGVLWVGTEIGGINKHDPFKTKFFHIRYGNGQKSLSHPQVWSFWQDDLEYLWIGTSAGLDRLNRRTGEMSHYYHDPNDSGSLSNDHINKVFEDRDGVLWFATNGGLNRFNQSNDSFSHYLPDPEDPHSLSSQLINDIYEDKYGYLWVGTAGYGLDRLDPITDRFAHFQYQEGQVPVDMLPTNTILSFFEDEGDTLWVGTMGGLIKIDLATEGFTYYRHQPDDPDSLSHNTVDAIHRDQAGTLWLATGNGLDQFNPVTESFGHYREKDGLSNNAVLGILEDSEGNLWLATHRGLSKFNPQDGSFRNYETSEGLQSLEFNSGAFYQNRYGEMFFGGINGFNHFHPEEVLDNPYAPPVIITDLQIGNESVPVGPDSPLQQSIHQTDYIELPGQDSVLSFELASLHYSTPEEIQYAYMMEGFDANWNYIGNRRFATYTNLPPGDYIFRAVGTNSDGVWSEEGVTVNVSVPYPYWQSWWFAALMLALVAGGIAGGYRLRTRSIATRTRELEEQVAARTAEIEQRREIAEGLREILILINTNRSLEESLHYIVSQAARLTDAEDAIIFRYSEDNPMTIVATNPGLIPRYALAHPGLTGPCLVFRFTLAMRFMAVSSCSTIRNGRSQMKNWGWASPSPIRQP